MKADHRGAALPARTRALLDYAERLAARPWTVTREHVDALRAHGLTDEDLTDAVHNVAIFAYLTRVAHGLGVELEPFMLAGGEEVEPGTAPDA